MHIDILGILIYNSYIDVSGIKQKAIAEKCGLDESKLCMSLQGKRKFEAGEYADVCKALKVPMTRFVKQSVPEEKEE